MRRFLILLSLLGLAAGPAGRATPAVQTHEEKPVYPDEAVKLQLQGNVVLTGAIDVSGKPIDLSILASSHGRFEESAVQGFRAWKFTPATYDGKPITVAVNACMRFRLESKDRGKIPSPILGDIEVRPTDGSGRLIAPDGFHVGTRQGVRAQLALDIPRSDIKASYRIRVEEIGPGAATRGLFDRKLTAAPNREDIRFVVEAPPPSSGRSPGVYRLAVTVDGRNAGGGTFWVTDDPVKFNWRTAPRAPDPVRPDAPKP